MSNAARDIMRHIDKQRGDNPEELKRLIRAKYFESYKEICLELAKQANYTEEEMTKLAEVLSSSE